MTAYYNELDPYAAQWLRNLISAGHIAPGDVDERSITDVSPTDLAGYTQCHFFAGIGGWSHALRLAGWPDHRRVWTGSCPCQPFSVAGAGAGIGDERHLWPAWFRLIAECRPVVVFGEQVEAAIRHGWLDLVQGNLESVGYAVGAAGIPAASVGAPHIRQRLWFVADSDNARLARRERGAELEGQGVPTGQSVASGGLARSTGERYDWWRSSEARNGINTPPLEPERFRDARGLADADSGRPAPGRVTAATARYGDSVESDGGDDRPSPSNGFWVAADWIHCRDAKWRPVEPGTQPLAHGVSNRVGRLRAYGNAIVPQVAATFVKAYLSVKGE
jgi:DNA (cytosine-5)-methyltransferase 1